MVIWLGFFSCLGYSREWTVFWCTHLIRWIITHVWAGRLTPPQRHGVDYLSVAKRQYSWSALNHPCEPSTPTHLQVCLHTDKPKCPYTFKWMLLGQGAQWQLVCCVHGTRSQCEEKSLTLRWISGVWWIPGLRLCDALSTTSFKLQLLHISTLAQQQLAQKGAIPLPGRSELSPNMSVVPTFENLGKPPCSLSKEVLFLRAIVTGLNNCG